MTSFYTPLEQEALLHIAGPDSLTFLQGQVTCDTRSLDAQQALVGAYCTPQGRMVCDFLLCQLGPEHFALRMRRDIRKDSAAIFGKYIIFSKAELDAQSDDWQVLGCWGPGAAGALRDIFDTVPDQHLGTRGGEGFLLVQLDEQGEQFECYLDKKMQAVALPQLDELLTLSVESAWQALDIRRGIGRVEAATSGEFIPQMLNYDLTGHVSFSKGCYTGQEVVARMHYRGKPKRRMYLASVDTNVDLAAGTPLYSGGEQSVGNIVNNCVVDGATLSLVVATAEGVENGLLAGAANGPALLIGELPYSLTAE